MAKIHRENGQLESSVRLYKQALALAPRNVTFAVGYIWWLFDLNQKVELRRTLVEWNGREKAMQELTEPFALAYVSLGEYQRAVRLFRTVYEIKKNNPSWLLVYADTLEKAGLSDEAQVERLRSMKLDTREYSQLPDWQVQTLYAAHPGWVRFKSELREQSGIGFWDQNLSLAIPLLKRCSLRLDVSYEEIRSRSSGNLVAFPNRIQSGRAGLGIRRTWGSTEFLAGVRNGLSPHFMLSLLSDLKLGGRGHLYFTVHGGAPATETVLLELGGLKDEASVALFHALSLRKSFVLKVTGRMLNDQERRQLGEGASLESEATHRLVLGWPDINLRVFGGYHYYKQTATPQGQTLAMIPSGNLMSGSYFVPSTFYDVGFGASLGHKGRQNHIRRWQPFAAADMIWNGQSGLGYRGELGLVGPIVGLDNFELALAQDRGAFGRSEKNTRFDLRYRLNY